jgi:hypothetical protein
VLDSKCAAAQARFVFIGHGSGDVIYFSTPPRRIIAASSPHHRLERHSVDCGRANYVGPMTNFHDLEMTSITGEQVSFGELKGNLALVVNVASA